MTRSRSQSNPREAGSAYLVALLVLLVLTVLGLSLALVTQSELQIGANEKTINRTFYGAESGLAAAEARLMGNDTDHDSKFEIKDGGPNPYNLRTRVDAGIPVIISVGHANLSAINTQGASTNLPTKRLSFGVVSQATRLAGLGSEADRVPLGRRGVAMVMDLSPQDDSVKAATGSDDQESVENLKNLG